MERSLPADSRGDQCSQSGVFGAFRKLGAPGLSTAGATDNFHQPDFPRNNAMSRLNPVNKKARKIDRALTVLEEAGRLTRVNVLDNRGRPAETWRP